MYSPYQFAATGRNADGTRFDIAAELGIEKVSCNEYIVSDIDKFLDWAAQPPKIKGGGTLYGFEDGIEEGGIRYKGRRP